MYSSVYSCCTGDSQGKPKIFDHAIRNSVFCFCWKIFGVGLSMTKETIAYFNDEEPPKDQTDGGHHLLWASREVLAGAGFSEKSDVYSFGIVLWEIMQADGSLPYDGLRQEEVSQLYMPVYSMSQ